MPTDKLKEMDELKNNHFATIKVKISTGKDDQWMLNPGGKFNKDTEDVIGSRIPVLC